jgi:RNA polymerase sigma-70 factor (ECF subfamily)
MERDAPGAAPGPAEPIGDITRSLAVERREAFVLTQLLGFSYEEASVVLDCPVGTIRSRVARARADLVAILERAEAL